MAKRKHKTPELTEDIEVIGPGQMLAEARESMGLSPQDVAAKLNFTVSLVNQIEAEQFDDSLPSTFTRGYLKNYAKLVNVSCDDVLASYEMLGIAQRQGAEMQSFSKGTKKQAENNRLMWLTYLILVALVALTVVWWWQNYQANNEVSVTPQSVATNAPEVVNSLAEDDNTGTSDGQAAVFVADIPTAEVEADNGLPAQNQAVVEQGLAATTIVSESQPQINDAAEAQQQAFEPEIKSSTVVFSFAGDCWVNIYDATGERIAWGIKNADYVMTITGQAPFNVTLGKPELVSIQFDGSSVDMSSFGAGNIAKFKLPLEL